LFLVNPAMVALFAAIHSYAPVDKKTYSLTAFGFLLVTVTITAFVHFAQLFVVRRTESATVTEVLRFYPLDGRLTPMFAADMLAWDFFFGFALLFAAPAFEGDRLQNVVRIGFVICGILCLVGVAFPITGDERFQLPAILGYAFGFPILCLLLALLFSRKNHETPDPGSQLS
jgi:hypothetical protein